MYIYIYCQKHCDKRSQLGMVFSDSGTEYTLVLLFWIKAWIEVWWLCTADANSYMYEDVSGIAKL